MPVRDFEKLMINPFYQLISCFNPTRCAQTALAGGWDILFQSAIWTRINPVTILLISA